tara:strand:- start:666 stop:1010 length:345 start_codon:yes stop_codon:yes gene_type:complete
LSRPLELANYLHLHLHPLAPTIEMMRERDDPSVPNPSAPHPSTISSVLGAPYRPHNHNQRNLYCSGRTRTTNLPLPLPKRDNNNNSTISTMTIAMRIVTRIAMRISILAVPHPP